jgi:RNA polymerase sigma factor (sigma-70 family)
MSDAQLLYRYAQLGEGLAFQQLMQRHGPLVWGVCHRLLLRVHDAEDAFQATFLVLSKKASSLQRPASLASWLYGVAHRVARKVRSQRRPTKPLPIASLLAVEQPDLLLHQEQARQLDDAVRKLPRPLQHVFLLCDVEELSAQEAAHRLGIPEGTVYSRLHRARHRLRGLLRKHGCTPALLLAGATVPDSLQAATLRSILTSTTTASVQALAQGVLLTMFWIPCSAALVTATLGIVGIGSATYLEQPGSERATAPTSPVKVLLLDEKDRRIQELELKLKQAVDEARMMRDQLDQQRRLHDKTQQFLQNQLLGEANRKEQKTLAEKDVQERQKQEAERLMKDMEKSRRMEVELTRSIDTIVNHLSELESQMRESVKQEKALDRAVQILHQMEEDLSKHTDFGSKDEERIITLRKACEMQQQRVSKLSQIVNVLKRDTLKYTRLQNQLKLREKLLLEVEESKLRMQLQLDQ